MTSIRLSIEGKKQVEKAQAMNGYSQARWAESAGIAESTLKRFVKGEKVKSETFKVLCETIGLHDWANLVAWDETDSTQVRSLSDDVETLVSSNLNATTDNLDNPDVSKPSSGIAIVGNFSESKRQRVMALVELLKQELSDVSCYITEG